MMKTMESCVPPGFRFHPTDEELVGYYLRKKVASQKIDLDVIRDIDLYRIEPWDLKEHCKIGYEEQSEWYFFSYKDRKYPTGTRTNRATMAGFWKATGRDKAVHDKSLLIGMRKTLVFYTGRAPNGQKTDWIMHEYRLESDENAPPQEEGWVVCRAFKKRAAYSGRSIADAWLVDGNFPGHIDGSSAAAVAHTAVYPHSSNYSLCQPKSHLFKRETEHEALSLMNSSNFIELPQLDSPSAPLPALNEDRRADDRKVTTDWRALDKFVASQLSPEGGVDAHAATNASNADVGHSAELAAAMLLLDGDKEEDVIRWSGLLELQSAAATCSGRESGGGDGIRVCMFDKI